MIRVKVVEIGTKKFEVSVTGHSGYANKGKDIVCAAVSSVVQATVNGLLEIVLSDVKLFNSWEKYSFEVEKNEKTEILVYSMLIALKDLSSQYPKNISVMEEFKNV